MNHYIRSFCLVLIGSFLTGMLYGQAGIVHGTVTDSEGETLIGATIMVQGTTATIEDLGSKNGTYLNGKRLEQPALLANGDEIWIGRSVARLRFLVEGEPTITEKTVP